MTDRYYRRLLGPMVLAALVFGACAEGKLEPQDDDNDDDPPRQVTEEASPAVEFSAGGGTDESEHYRADVTVGTPVPVRRGESRDYQVELTAGPAIQAPEVEDDQ